MIVYALIASFRRQRSLKPSAIFSNSRITFNTFQFKVNWFLACSLHVLYKSPSYFLWFRTWLSLAFVLGGYNCPLKLGLSRRFPGFTVLSWLLCIWSATLKENRSGQTILCMNVDLCTVPIIKWLWLEVRYIPSLQEFIIYFTEEGRFRIFFISEPDV